MYPNARKCRNEPSNTGGHNAGKDASTAGRARHMPSPVCGSFILPAWFRLPSSKFQLHSTAAAGDAGDTEDSAAKHCKTPSPGADSGADIQRRR